MFFAADTCVGLDGVFKTDKKKNKTLVTPTTAADRCRCVLLLRLRLPDGVAAWLLLLVHVIIISLPFFSSDCSRCTRRT